MALKYIDAEFRIVLNRPLVDISAVPFVAGIPNLRTITSDDLHSNVCLAGLRKPLNGSELEPIIEEMVETLRTYFSRFGYVIISYTLENSNTW